MALAASAMRRGIRGVPVLLLGLSLWLGIGEAAAQETPERGGTALFAVGQDPTAVNPAVSTNPPDRLVGCILYEGLIQVSPDYKILPLLAKSWTISPDGLTYSFDLQTAKWHDGQAVTSEDVKVSLLDIAAKYSATFAPAGRAIESIDTPASDKVVIKLKRSFGPFMLSLACPQGGVILPAHLFKGTDPLKNPATSTNATGTGPFKLQEWKRGDYLRLARNTDYHVQGKPYLDEVIAKVIPQATGRLQALQAGEIDLVQFLPGNDQAAARASAKLKVVTSDIAPGISVLALNTTHKPLDDKRVRQALMMATDRDYLLKNAFVGWGDVGFQPFTTEIGWAANPDIDFRTMYPYDVARANALLDEAGVKRGADGVRFVIHNVTYSTQSPQFLQASFALKSMWRAVGVDLQTDAMEDSILFKRVYKDRDFDMMVYSINSYADPALGLARAYVSSTIGEVFGDTSLYSNPEVDRLFEEGTGGTSFEERGKAYRRVQAILAEDLPSLTIQQYRNMDAASKRLQGLWGTIQGTGYWAGAWLSP